VDLKRSEKCLLIAYNLILKYGKTETKDHKTILNAHQLMKEKSLDGGSICAPEFELNTEEK
jgi:hypothetical protein